MRRKFIKCVDNKMDIGIFEWPSIQDNIWKKIIIIK